MFPLWIIKTMLLVNIYFFKSITTEFIFSNIMNSCCESNLLIWIRLVTLLSPMLFYFVYFLIKSSRYFTWNFWKLENYDWIYFSKNINKMMLRITFSLPGCYSEHQHHPQINYVLIYKSKFHNNFYVTWNICLFRRIISLFTE
jgi:hypothetical protein